MSRTKALEMLRLLDDEQLLRIWGDMQKEYELRSGKPAVLEYTRVSIPNPTYDKGAANPYSPRKTGGHGRRGLGSRQGSRQQSRRGDMRSRSRSPGRSAAKRVTSPGASSASESVGDSRPPSREMSIEPSEGTTDSHQPSGRDSPADYSAKEVPLQPTGSRRHSTHAVAMPPLDDLPPPSIAVSRRSGQTSRRGSTRTEAPGDGNAEFKPFVLHPWGGVNEDFRTFRAHEPSIQQVVAARQEEIRRQHRATRAASPVAAAESSQAKSPSRLSPKRFSRMLQQGSTGGTVERVVHVPVVPLEPQQAANQRVPATHPPQPPPPPRRQHHLPPNVGALPASVSRVPAVPLGRDPFLAVFGDTDDGHELKNAFDVGDGPMRDRRHEVEKLKAQAAARGLNQRGGGGAPRLSAVPRVPVGKPGMAATSRPATKKSAGHVVKDFSFQ
jgi:hypothetical protein